MVKRVVSGLLMVWLLGLPFAVQSQTALPTPSPLPSPYTPPPTSTPTATPAALIPNLSMLQTINTDNLAQLQPLVRLSCANPEGLGGGDGIRDLSSSPTRNLLAAVIYSGACLYDLGAPQSDPIDLEAISAWSVVFSPDGETMATLHNGDDAVRLWDVATWESRPSSLEAAYTSLDYPTLAYSPDGRYIATAPYFGGLNLYDAATETLLVRVRVTDQWSVYFNGDGTRLVSVGWEGISLWTLLPGPRLYRDQVLPLDQDSRDIRITVGGEGGNLMLYPFGGKLIVYDLVQDQPIEERTPIYARNITFLPDDTLSLMYDPDTFEILSPAFMNANEWVFSADGKLFATVARQSELLQIWGVPE